MYLQLLSIKGCDAIRQKLNCLPLVIISVAKLSGFPPLRKITFRVPMNLCVCVRSEFYWCGGKMLLRPPIIVPDQAQWMQIHILGDKGI